VRGSPPTSSAEDLGEEIRLSTQSAPHLVVVHVGAPKSGTTFLQRTLWNLRGPLREAGFTCPGTTQQEMFHAAIEVRERFEFWGQDPEVLGGTWARLCQEAREFEGTTVMSHELLAAATAEQAARALQELDGLEVHLVYTARDLARQVMSEWQERVKNGSTNSFAEFEQVITKQLRQGDTSALFWRNHHMLEVLDRWSVGVPPARVHVVTAPPAGADPSELWHRFGEAVGFDAGAFDLPTTERSSNESLGVVQVAALRRVNEALDGRIPQPDYGRFVKRQFSQRLLVRQSSPRPVCPPELVTELRQVAETVNAAVRDRGYSVHGDLADLVPVLPTADAVRPDDVPLQEQVEALAAAVAELLVDRQSGQRPRPGDGSKPTVPPTRQESTGSPLARWPRALGQRLRAALRRGHGAASRRVARG
jgi:hypothetical protein